MELTEEETVTSVVQSLKILTEAERSAIQKVVERDTSLKNQQEQKFRRLKSEIQTLQRARDAEADFGLNKGACALCMVTFGRVFNRGASCRWCRRMVCSACRLCAYSSRKEWMCSLCTKEWQLRKMSGDWMKVPDAIHHRMSMSLVILKSLQAMKQLLEPRSRTSKGHPSGNEPFSQIRSTADVASPQLQLLPLDFDIQMCKVIGTNGPLSRVASNPSLASRITETIQQAKRGILHAQSDALLYLHSGYRMEKPKPRTLSEESKVRRQLDFGEKLESIGLQQPGPAPVVTTSSFAIHQDRSEGSVYHFSSAHIDDFPETDIGIVSSTPLSLSAQSMAGTVANLRPPLALDMSISSVASDWEVGHASHLGSQSCGDIELQVALNYNCGAIEVSVMRCRNLPPVSQRSTKMPSPYVKLYLCGAKGGYSKRKTSTKTQTFNPVFGEVLRFSVFKEKTAGWSLRVAVCHKESIFRTSWLGGNRLQRTVTLGQTSMLMTETLLSIEHPLWVGLHK